MQLLELKRVKVAKPKIRCLINFSFALFWSTEVVGIEDDHVRGSKKQALGTAGTKRMR